MDKSENRKGVANFINFYMHIIIVWLAFKMAHIKAIEPKKICRSQNGSREILRLATIVFNQREYPGTTVFPLSKALLILLTQMFFKGNSVTVY